MQILNLARNSVSALAIGAVITVGACTPFSGPSSSYCINHRSECLILGFVIVAGLLFLSNGSSSTMHSYYYMSDATLKTDIKKLETLENGLTIYAFRYIGDDRFFAGVLAQDLLDHDEYKHAVKRSSNGYLMVDYSKLPVQGVDMDIMQRASEAVQSRL